VVLAERDAAPRRRRRRVPDRAEPRLPPCAAGDRLRGRALSCDAPIMGAASASGSDATLSRRGGCGHRWADGEGGGRAPARDRLAPQVLCITHCRRSPRWGTATSRSSRHARRATRTVVVQLGEPEWSPSWCHAGRRQRRRDRSQARPRAARAPEPPRARSSGPGVTLAAMAATRPNRGYGPPSRERTAGLAPRTRRCSPVRSPGRRTKLLSGVWCAEHRAARSPDIDACPRGADRGR